MDQPVNRASALDADVPVDRLVLQLRSYAYRLPKSGKQEKLTPIAEGTTAPAAETSSAPRQAPRRPRANPEKWVLVFDCETTTTPEQRLRFGAYQLRYNGRLWEKGVFYDPGAITDADRAVLAQVVEEELLASDNGRVFLITRDEFVERVFYRSGFDIGAQIVGFNLPFDLARIAIGSEPAQRLKGGFSLKLADGHPNVAVKHISRKSAFIQFVGTDGRTEEGEEIDAPAAADLRRNPDRGYFVDVKTLAATLTGHAGSLAALSADLKVKTVKEDRDDHGEAITPDYVRYGMKDVQSTWECFEILAGRLADLNLAEAGAYSLYSEASLGKAYLRTMRILPWRTVQPDFPPDQIGEILSGYYGGRAEVRIRRQPVEVLHCDFLSMYPTVCTLMNLWSFVRSTGINWRDDTADVRRFVDCCTAETLQTPDRWPALTVMVQVMPDHDLFPVRAVYRDGDAATIGLNYLTADEPMWFTLADVLVSKILTGRAPKILKATRYAPKPMQKGLKAVTVAGAVVDPTMSDFYASIIDHRQVLKEKENAAGSEAERRAYNRDQKAMKTLANATSYGIFVELNVEDFTDNHDMIGHDVGGEAFRFRAKKYERPGRYFHPLLGTLITGAARLMLALAEHRVTQAGLDWAFCDTDSLAIANTAGLPSEVFRAKAITVADWFASLCPYTKKQSILQVEDYNYGPRGQEKKKLPVPLRCFAVSAKRYVLYNRDAEGSIVVRKASGHGLGHLLPPYDEPPAERRGRIKAIGVPLWQEDLWSEIARAGESDNPDAVNLKRFAGYDAPAASQYAATSPRLLKWFDPFNKGQSYAEQVKPFGFLLSLQVKADIQLAANDEGVLVDGAGKAHVPRAVSEYCKHPIDAAQKAFDRRTSARIPADQLRSHRESLMLYDMHPEGKFHGGNFDERGTLRRRHVHAIAFRAIGKEADNIEAQEFVQDDEGPIERPLTITACRRLIAFVDEVKAEVGFSDRELLDEAHVHRITLTALRGGTSDNQTVAMKLVRAAKALQQRRQDDGADDEAVRDRLVTLTDQLGGVPELAVVLNLSRQQVWRVMNGKSNVSDEFRARLQRAFER